MEMKSHEVWEEHLNQSLSPEVAFGRAWRRDLDHAQGMVATPTQNSWGIIATASTWNKRNTQQLRRKVATYYVLISFTNPECRPSEWRDNEFQSLPNTQINSRGRLQHIYWTHSIKESVANTCRVQPKNCQHSTNILMQTFMMFHFKNRLKYIQNSSKMHPKSLQMAPWDPLWITSQSGDPSWTFSDDILEPLWSPMGSLGTPQITNKYKKYR